MGAVETEAVILRTYKLAEADKIFVCLTKSEGTIRGVARGARRLKSQFGASLEPFTHATLSYFVKEGRELVTLKRAEIIQSYFALSKRPEVIGTLEHFGQLVIEFAPPNQPDEKIFKLVTACLAAAAVIDADCVQALRPYFELWLLRLNGFLPDLGACGGCGRVIKAGVERVSMTTEGALRCEACADGIAVSIDPTVHGQLFSMGFLAPSKWARQFQNLSEGRRNDIARLATWLTVRALEKHPVPTKIKG